MLTIVWVQSKNILIFYYYWALSCNYIEIAFAFHLLLLFSVWSLGHVFLYTMGFKDWYFLDVHTSFSAGFMATSFHVGCGVWVQKATQSKVCKNSVIIKCGISFIPLQRWWWHVQKQPKGYVITTLPHPKPMQRLVIVTKKKFCSSH
jgi:hypothetical protein